MLSWWACDGGLIVWCRGGVCDAQGTYTFVHTATAKPINITKWIEFCIEYLCREEMKTDCSSKMKKMKPDKHRLNLIRILHVAVDNNYHYFSNMSGLLAPHMDPSSSFSTRSISFSAWLIVVLVMLHTSVGRTNWTFQFNFVFLFKFLFLLIRFTFETDCAVKCQCK